MKQNIRKLCTMMCLAALCIQMIPPVAAADLATDLLGEQVINKESLSNLYLLELRELCRRPMENI